MGTILVLTDEHMRSNHPDHQAIRDWFKANGIDDAWIRVPSVVKINQDAIIVEVWMHDDKGSLLLDPNNEHFWAPNRYECTPTALPMLYKTAVGTP